MARLTLTFQTVSLPTGSGGASVTVYEDVGNDGSGPSTDPNGRPYDNSDTVTLSDGVTEYTTGDVFNGASGDAVWMRPQLGPPSDVTVTGATVVPASVMVAVPNAPPNLTVTEVTDTPSVALSWQDVSGEDEYRIYRSTSPGSTLGDYTQIDTVGAGVTSYTDTSVSVETTYYYRVSAANTQGESSPSRERRARVGDGFTDSVSWDSETEWDYGSFTDTDTDGAGSLVLGARDQDTFDYFIDPSNDGVPSEVEIRDATTSTVLASAAYADRTETQSGSFTIDTGQHPDLELYAFAEGDTDGGTDLSATAEISYNGTVLVSATASSSGNTDTDTLVESYTYADSGSWTSPDWDFGATTTATKLSWSGVTLPNPGDTLTVTITEVGGGTTVQVSPTAGSGSELFALAPGDTYRVDASMSTVDDSTTPEVGSLTLETHTPTANLTVTDTRDAEIDLAWDAVSVADGYEVYQSETTPVDTGDSLAYSNTDPGDTSATITGLENGERYYFNVRTVYSGE